MIIRLMLINIVMLFTISYSQTQGLLDTLLVKDFKPKSIYNIPVSKIQKAKFPIIDMHSHADLTILQINRAEPSIRQGVTTLVVGMCGLGLAPANDKVRKY